jgi:hypothetical protein
MREFGADASNGGNILCASSTEAFHASEVPQKSLSQGGSDTLDGVEFGAQGSF